MHRRERRGTWLSSYADRRGVLRDLLQRRDEVLSRLTDLLQQQHVAHEQDARRAAEQQELDKLQAVTQQKQRELAKVRELADSQRAANQSRRITTSSKSAQLSTARLSVAPLVLPQELRTHEMAVLHAWLGLLGEQRCKLSQLLEILPLRVEGLRSTPAPSMTSLPNLHPGSSPATAPPSGAASPSGRLSMGSLPSGLGLASSPSQQQQWQQQQQQQQLLQGAQSIGGITVSLCGIRLPDSLAVLQPHMNTKPLCAVLGYALLLLDLAAAYLGAPILHEGSFQGSTSVVWQQQSFWNRRPAGSHCVLPLFIEPGLVAATVAPLSNMSSTAKSKSASSSSWGGLPLMRAITTPSHAPGPGGSAASGGSTPAVPEGGSGPLAARGPELPTPGESKHMDLQLAFEMLQRSCLCMVRHCAATGSLAHGNERRPSHVGQPPFSHPFLLGSSSSSSSQWPQHSHSAGWLGLPQGPGAGWPGGPLHGATKLAAEQAVSGAGPGLPLPQSWSAWGCLVVLCAALLQEDGEGAAHASSAAAKLGGVLPTATQAVQAEAAASQAAWAWHQAPAALPVPGSGAAQPGEEAAEDEGWDVVHSVLPPPPSSEDVEQYARALFSDGNTGHPHPPLGAATPSSFLASNGQQAVSALTRALSLTGRAAATAGAAGLAVPSGAPSPSPTARGHAAGMATSQGQGPAGPVGAAGLAGGSSAAGMAAAPSSSPLSSSMSLLGSLLQGRGPAASGTSVARQTGTSPST